MARSPIYSTLTKVQGMITYVRMNLSEEEYDLFLDMLVPEPEPEVKTVKRGRKKGGKSKRAASLEEQIKPAIGRQQAGSVTHCAHAFSGGNICAEIESSGIHDVAMGYQNYHPFRFPVPSAKKKSSAKGAETNSIANSETEKGAALAVAGGSNE